MFEADANLLNCRQQHSWSYGRSPMLKKMNYNKLNSALAFPQKHKDRLIHILDLVLYKEQKHAAVCVVAFEHPFLGRLVVT